MHEWAAEFKGRKIDSLLLYKGIRIYDHNGIRKQVMGAMRRHTPICVTGAPNSGGAKLILYDHKE